MARPKHAFESSSGGCRRCRRRDEARRTLLEQHSVVALSCDACKAATAGAGSCIAPRSRQAGRCKVEVQQAAPGCTSDTYAMQCGTPTLPA